MGFRDGDILLLFTSRAEARVVLNIFPGLFEMPFMSRKNAI